MDGMTPQEEADAMLEQFIEWKRLRAMKDQRLVESIMRAWGMNV
jgi:hypothetical protein